MLVTVDMLYKLSVCVCGIHLVGNETKWSTFYAPPCRYRHGHARHYLIDNRHLSRLLCRVACYVTVIRRETRQLHCSTYVVCSVCGAVDNAIDRLFIVRYHRFCTCVIDLRTEFICITTGDRTRVTDSARRIRHQLQHFVKICPKFGD